MEDSGPRPHRVRQTPDEIGDEQDQERAGEDDGRLVEGHDEGHTDDGPRNRIGHHHAGVQHRRGGGAPAHHQIGDQRPQEDVQHRGDRGECEAIGNGARDAEEDLPVVPQAEVRVQHRSPALEERGHDHHDRRDQRQADHEVDTTRTEPLHGGPEANGRDRPELVHGVAPPPHRPVLDQQDAGGAEHQQGGRRAGHGGVSAHLVHEQAVHDGGEDLISLADDHGRAELGEGREEDQERPAQDRGQRDRDGDRPEHPPGAGPQALCRLLQRLIQGAQRPGHHQEHERVQVQAERQDDPVHAVDGGNVDTDRLEEARDVPGAPEQEDP